LGETDSVVAESLLAATRGVPFLHAEHPERCETRSFSGGLILGNCQIYAGLDGCSRFM